MTESLALSAEQKEHLNAAWELCCMGQTEEAGKIRLSDVMEENPALTQTITQIRDGYFTLLNRMMHVRAARDRCEQTTALEQALSHVNYDLLLHNHESYKALVGEGANAPDHTKTAPLSPEDAQGVVCRIIKHTISAFIQTFPEAFETRELIPNIPLDTDPTSLPMYRPATEIAARDWQGLVAEAMAQERPAR
jgi:hypothetical protein